MPDKVCPDCGLSLHVRKRECSCGFVFPFKKKKTTKKKKALDKHAEVDYKFNGWKKVPPNSRMLSCGLCRRKMKGGMLGWHSAYTDGEKFWWCEKCYGEDQYITCFKDFKDETFDKHDVDYR